ncbi:MAG: sugar porter family MFS transporter [bacterium]|nr:sugar porter family MFS transporter [bacterium]
MNEKNLIQEIKDLKQEVAEIKKAKSPGGFKNFIKNSVSKLSLVIGITLAFTISSIFLYASQIFFEEDTIIRSSDVNKNFSELYERLSGLGGAKCYTSSYTGHDMSSAAWTDLDGLTPCTMTTNGRPLKVTMDFSVYGIHHGGIRIVMDDNTVLHMNSTYGMDWVIAQDNVWQKQNFMRILEDIPAGEHSFKVQIRSQANGSRFYIGTGTESDKYAGFHFLIEEI